MPSHYTLGRDDQKFVDDLLERGRYSSASEVVQEGLRVLQQREQLRDIKLDSLRTAIQDGLASGKAERLDIEAIKSVARLKNGDHDA